LLIYKLGPSSTSYRLCMALVGSYATETSSYCVPRPLAAATAGPVFIKRALVKKGARPSFKNLPLKKMKAGYYRVIMTIAPLDGRRPAMLSSQRFYVNAKHRIVPSKTKAPAKKTKVQSTKKK
jgi:hypothetical protein